MIWIASDCIICIEWNGRDPMASLFWKIGELFLKVHVICAFATRTNVLNHEIQVTWFSSKWPTLTVQTVFIFHKEQTIKGPQTQGGKGFSPQFFTLLCFCLWSLKFAICVLRFSVLKKVLCFCLWIWCLRSAICDLVN